MRQNHVWPECMSVGQRVGTPPRCGRTRERWQIVCINTHTVLFLFCFVFTKGDFSREESHRRLSLEGKLGEVGFLIKQGKVIRDAVYRR